MSKELKCWSCKAVFTLSEHGNCDGCCWKCGVEIDLDEMDIRPADQQGEPVAWQWRRKTVQEGSQWTAWTDCTKGDYEACIASPQPSVRGVIREARRLYAAQPATAKVDEDEEFEKAYQSVIDNGWTNVKNMARQVWQARAKLNGAPKVVLPERLDVPHRGEFESANQHAAAVGEAKSYNACLDEVAKLNGEKL